MVLPPRDPGEDAAAENFAERVGSGPWVIVPASDAGPRALAIEFAKECRRRRVGERVATIDMLHGRELQRFRGLVIVLRDSIPDDDGADALVELRELGSLIERFRAYNPLGLNALLSGRCQWFEAGTVQVVGPPALLRHRSLHRAPICVEHPVSRCDGKVDLFAPFAGTAAPKAPPVVAAAEHDEIDRLMADLATWNVTEYRQVPPLYRAVEAQREEYENPDLLALFRPVPLVDANRLDIVLDGIRHAPTAHHKAFTESGARVVRETIRVLQRIVPGLADPHLGRKGAQERFRLFVLALRAVDLHLQGGADDEDRPAG